MKDFVSLTGWLLVAVVSIAILSLRHRGSLTVAANTFRQFLQIRLFLPSLLTIFAAFALIAVIESANPADRLRLLQANIFAAAGLVAAIIVLTQAATSFGREVDLKQAYHLFSKPLPREAFAAGRTSGIRSQAAFSFLSLSCST